MIVGDEISSFPSITIGSIGLTDLFDNHYSQWYKLIKVLYVLLGALINNE
jgi:hypothetical protein